MLPTPSPDALAHSRQVTAHIAALIEAADGWIPFSRYMEAALYAPGLGYYAAGATKFGRAGDFTTAPEITPLFGRTLARAVAPVLAATGGDVLELGAGSGRLAADLLGELERLDALPARYAILEPSPDLAARQRALLADERPQLLARTCWLDTLPAAFNGVILGNEVLDAMPVQLLQRIGGQADGVWHERGVALTADGALAWADRPSSLRPPLEIEGPHDYLTEIHPQAEAFVRTLAERWARGAAFFIDYGFPEAEYYHPQRHMGTLICHRAHRSDDNPLVDLGLKDITAHVNFTGVALAAQDAGLAVLGYTSQGRFLINAGLLDVARDAGPRDQAMLGKLVNEHEMGELFKVLVLAPAASSEGWVPLGFTAGDRTHRL